MYYIFVGSSGIPSAEPPPIYFTFYPNSQLVYKPVFYSNSQTTRILPSTLSKPLFASLGDLAINTALKAIKEKFVTLRVCVSYFSIFYLNPILLNSELKIVTLSKLNEFLCVSFPVIYAIFGHACYVPDMSCKGVRRVHNRWNLRCWGLLLDDVSTLQWRMKVRAAMHDAISIIRFTDAS